MCVRQEASRHERQHASGYSVEWRLPLALHALMAAARPAPSPGPLAPQSEDGSKTVLVEWGREGDHFDLQEQAGLGFALGAATPAGVGPPVALCPCPAATPARRPAAAPASGACRCCTAPWG